MNHSTKKRHHEEARKRHKQEQQAHARELARRGRSRLPQVALAGAVALAVALVLFVSFR